MRTDTVLKRYATAAATCIALAGLATTASAQAPANEPGLPAYMAPISGRTTSTPAETATKNVLALNTMMFELYGNAAQIFQKNFLSKHPVILGLFSGAGGRFILYRPGQAPLNAPQVPIVYQLLKSVGHSTMALAETVGPYLDNPADQSWRGPMLAFRARMQAALDGLEVEPDAERHLQPEDEIAQALTVAFASLSPDAKAAVQDQINHAAELMAGFCRLDAIAKAQSTEGTS